MLHENLRQLHEDIERLESAISDRVLDEPKHLRNRLVRDHEISTFLSRIHNQSEHALEIYNTQQEARTREIQSISTGDVFEEFYKQLDQVKSFHKRYPNEPVENLERAYKKVEHGGSGGFAGDIDSMFTGEEAFGRFLDLTMLHEEFLNLPGVKTGRKVTYLTYLDLFDIFVPPRCQISRQDKLTDAYFSYVTSLAQYLQSFMQRTKPLEDLERTFKSIDDEFEQAWDEEKVEGWEKQSSQAKTNGGPITEGTGEGIWCADCEKEFKNDNVFKAHLTGKKHINASKARQQQSHPTSDGDVEMTNGHTPYSSTRPNSTARLKEKAIAEREHRIRRLTSTLSSTRTSTRVNVERKAGMTDRERQQELAALYAEDAEAAATSLTHNDTSDPEDGEERVYNPLKLPLAWDGKPIPFWLYKLHGLGVEFPCEVCGNYVYMGRRAFEKHFSEARHLRGLECLGIKNSGLFREITGIEEALLLARKLERDKEDVRGRREDVVEMEDSLGNVMPQKVYEDLAKQGIV